MPKGDLAGHSRICRRRSVVDDVHGWWRRLLLLLLSLYCSLSSKNSDALLWPSAPFSLGWPSFLCCTCVILCWPPFCSFFFSLPICCVCALIYRPPTSLSPALIRFGACPPILFSKPCPLSRIVFPHMIRSPAPLQSLSPNPVPL